MIQKQLERTNPPHLQAEHLENFAKTPNKMIYGTLFLHPPTEFVERGVRTLNEILLTKIKAGETFCKALDIPLDVMRKTQHTRLKKTAFELHYGRKQNTEISNLINLDVLKQNCVSQQNQTPYRCIFSTELEVSLTSYR